MCIFCQIIKKEQISDIVFEDDETIAFKDINPKAPVHILIVPKKHIATINDITSEDARIVGNVVLLAKDIAKDQKIDDAYKLVFNVGRGGGQIIEHIHLHLLGGWSQIKN